MSLGVVQAPRAVLHGVAAQGTEVGPVVGAVGGIDDPAHVAMVRVLCVPLERRDFSLRPRRAGGQSVGTRVAFVEDYEYWCRRRRSKRPADAVDAAASVAKTPTTTEQVVLGKKDEERAQQQCAEDLETRERKSLAAKCDDVLCVQKWPPYFQVTCDEKISVLLTCRRAKHCVLSS